MEGSEGPIQAAERHRPPRRPRRLAGRPGAPLIIICRRPRSRLGGYRPRNARGPGERAQAGNRDSGVGNFSSFPCRRGRGVRIPFSRARTRTGKGSGSGPGCLSRTVSHSSPRPGALCARGALRSPPDPSSEAAHKPSDSGRTPTDSDWRSSKTRQSRRSREFLAGRGTGKGKGKGRSPFAQDSTS